MPRIFFVINEIDQKRNTIVNALDVTDIIFTVNAICSTSKAKIEKIKFNNPSFEIINNVTAKAEKDANNIKKLLIDQIFSTVKWRESIINMSDAGVKNFIEIGPGKVLAGMVKRTIKNVNSFSINSIADIKNLNDRFKK